MLALVFRWNRQAMHEVLGFVKQDVRDRLDSIEQELDALRKED